MSCIHSSSCLYNSIPLSAIKAPVNGTRRAEREFACQGSEPYYLLRTHSLNLTDWSSLAISIAFSPVPGAGVPMGVGMLLNVIPFPRFIGIGLRIVPPAGRAGCSPVDLLAAGPGTVGGVGDGGREGTARQVAPGADGARSMIGAAGTGWPVAARRRRPRSMSSASLRRWALLLGGTAVVVAVPPGRSRAGTADSGSVPSEDAPTPSGGGALRRPAASLSPELPREAARSTETFLGIARFPVIFVSSACETSILAGSATTGRPSSGFAFSTIGAPTSFSTIGAISRDRPG